MKIGKKKYFFKSSEKKFVTSKMKQNPSSCSIQDFPRSLSEPTVSCQHHLKANFLMYFGQPFFCIFEWCDKFSFLSLNFLNFPLCLVLLTLTQLRYQVFPDLPRRYQSTTIYHHFFSVRRLTWAAEEGSECYI